MTRLRPIPAREICKNKMKTAAIYLRVSTGKQTTENQRGPLIQFAAKRGYKVYKIYQETASGKKSDRAELNLMLADAHKRAFDTIIVWSLDRLSREGLLKTMHMLEHLSNMGVSVISFSEPYLDTTNELAKNILLAVISTLAKAEREKISERTIAGLDRVRKQGKKLGRPAYPDKVRKEAKRLLKGGAGIRGTARILNVSPTFVSDL